MVLCRHYPCVCLLVAVFFALPLRAPSARAEASGFRCIVLSEAFHSEGADIADFNADGHPDVVSGPFWYEGPSFQTKHRYMPGERLSIKGYSQHFFSFAHDFNDDQRPDILVVGMPGDWAWWFENPGAADRLWAKHPVLDDCSNESPTFADFTGDGRPELVCIHAGAYGYAHPNAEDPTKHWSFHRVSAELGLGRFTHGLGIGDVDGDGRRDLLETNGWYRSTGNAYAHMPQRFAAAGGSQMFAYDFDGDGDNDVVSVQNAHAWGLKWFEQRDVNGVVTWVPHSILEEKPTASMDVSISQMHALALADIDGDGVKDIVTGKRFFAHGGNDPGAFQLPVLYWLRTVRGRDGVRFESHLIHRRVGVGTQLTTGDLNNDGRVDIVVGNKLGTFVLLNENEALPTPLPASDRQVGTPDFAQGVRDAESQTPEQEQASFILPEGFRAQLFAAEPEIAKPLNMAFDARGRLWVTSTLEYPYPVAVGKPGRDSIKILEDTDGDGRADRVTTFAEGLNIPIGLYPYRDGVVCYSIPNIYFFRDTDGDGVCDQREILYGPFDHTRDTHGMCNAFTRGYDGWLYACHGFNNQSSVSGADGNTVTMHSGNTFRFRLDGSRIEHFTHGQVNPFGMGYDARGDLLTADCHTKPVTLLLHGGYYESFGKPDDGLGFVPRVMEHLHGSTAIGGIAIAHADNGWPTDFQNNTFGGNVMTSRINRNSLRYDGASVRAQEEPDFLISGDSWFRPVDLQMGPDGALYVADFYNRIIGHYEVPLDHPGRDRHRGRIWKISYVGSTEQPSPTTGVDRVESSDLSKRTPSELVQCFRSRSHGRRMLAMDRLVDEFAERAETAARQGLDDGSGLVRLHSLWTLARIGRLTSSGLERGIRDLDVQVRMHAQKVLGSHLLPAELDHDQRCRWLVLGLADADPIVQRAAATSCHTVLAEILVSALIQCHNGAAERDVHLRHAARIGLKHQLSDERIFAAIVPRLDAADVRLVADVCLAVGNTAVGDFLAARLPELAEDPAQALKYVQHASRYLSPASIAEFVSLIRNDFSEDTERQFELIQSIANGFRRRSLDMPESMRAWAGELAEHWLVVDAAQVPLSWQAVRHPNQDDGPDTWSVSTSRNSADGEQASTLWSSFPKGEGRTGIFRSSTFTLGASFGFYIAGHDGYPNQELQHQNVVRVRDGVTHAILQSWSPPRQDVAVFRQWDTEENKGRSVYVELVDGDRAAAYAWLAVGRFTESRLNPGPLFRNRQRACQLIAEFQLDELRGNLFELLTQSGDDKRSRVLLAQTIAGLDAGSQRQAVADSLGIASLPADLLQKAFALLDAEQTDATSAVDYLAGVLKYASSVEQQRIADALAADAAGLDILVPLAETTAIDPRCLTMPAVRSKIDAVARSEQRAKIRAIMESQPDESDVVARWIQEQKSHFLSRSGNLEAGRALFQKQCSICHQVAGNGKQVGPNLDGIGKRGLDRLLEDVLAPNRNIDVAFRASTIVTNDGKVITGLVRGQDGGIVNVVDSQGEMHALPTAVIELQKQISLSPMPANFAEVLGKDALADLLSYVLSLD